MRLTLEQRFRLRAQRRALVEAAHHYEQQAQAQGLARAYYRAAKVITRQLRRTLGSNQQVA